MWSLQGLQRKSLKEVHKQQTKHLAQDVLDLGPSPEEEIG